MTKLWSPDDFEKVLQLKKSGLSTAQIAPHFNTTKNAIIGLLFRHKYEIDRDEIKPEPGQIPMTFEELATIAETDTVACRWVEGDPHISSWSFCNLPIHHKSYCETHYNLCWHKVKKKPKQNQTQVNYYFIPRNEIKFDKRKN